MSLAGCEPIQYVDAVGETGAPRFLLPLEGEGGGGFSTVGSVTGPIAELRYVADSEKRIYLLRGDLDEGIDPLGASVATLRFPESPDTSAERRVEVGEDQSWDSLRTYDMGACSLFLPWGVLQGLLNTRIVSVLDNPEMPAGPRSCRFGAELDRLMLMPEGVVFVYAESILDDFQGLIVAGPAFEEALFTNLGSPPLLRLLGAQYSCSSGRAPLTASGADPEPVSIRAIFDPSSL